MHAPLNVSDRQLLCSEYIQALEECHARGFFKLVGGCNQAKKDLSMCLRKERVDRTTRNRDEAKLRTAKKKEVWQALDKEMTGSQGMTASASTSTTTQAQETSTAKEV